MSQLLKDTVSTHNTPPRSQDRSQGLTQVNPWVRNDGPRPDPLLDGLSRLLPQRRRARRAHVNRRGPSVLRRLHTSIERRLRHDLANGPVPTGTASLTCVCVRSFVHSCIRAFGHACVVRGAWCVVRSACVGLLVGSGQCELVRDRTGHVPGDRVVGAPPTRPCSSSACSSVSRHAQMRHVVDVVVWWWWWRHGT